MPRINVEEEWFGSPRRKILEAKVGLSVDTVALGMWRLAQSYYRKGVLHVPAEIYDLMPHAREFEESLLARREPRGVYVCGSREQFEWLQKQREQGRRGGVASAKRRLSDRLAMAEPTPSDTQASSSSSSVPKGTVRCRPKTPPPDEIHLSLKGFWKKIWTSKWGAPYAWSGAEGKALSKVIEYIRGLNGSDAEQAAQELMKTYLADGDAYCVRAKHPLRLLASQPQRWTVVRRVVGPFRSKEDDEIANAS